MPEADGQRMQSSNEALERNVRAHSANPDPRTYHSLPPAELRPWSSSAVKSEQPEYTAAAIDILRESKQVASAVAPDFMQPRSYSSKLQTTSGVFFPEKPPAQSRNLQADAVDRHFHIALKKEPSGFGKPEPESMHASVNGLSEARYSSTLPYNHQQTISSCSSSSSVSSMAFDRDANSPGRLVKPFPNPQKRPQETQKSDACRFSLKKRLIQRYQADGAASLQEEAIAVVKVENEFPPSGSSNQLHDATDAITEADNHASNNSKCSSNVR